MRRAAGLMARHKIVTAISAAFVVAICVVSVIGTGSTQAAGTTGPPPLAPSFSLAALGKPSEHISLSQYAGRPLIVNFWASWCPPCQRETPLLARFYRSEHGRVIVVGVDENDGQASALRFARAKGVTYPIAFDPQVIAANAYNVGDIPQTFFLNARHRIVDRIFGAVTLAELTKGTALMNRG